MNEEELRRQQELEAAQAAAMEGQEAMIPEAAPLDGGLPRQGAPWLAMTDETSPARAAVSPYGVDLKAMDGFRALAQVIGKEQIAEANQILMKYKQGKANLERRIIDNEQWYKLRHWECMRQSKNQEVQPVSGWLFNAIENKHADAMDSYPCPNILPREEGDKQEAKMLSSIIPVVLEQADFEDCYDRETLYKVKMGTGVYGVFWDTDKLHGMGDVNIQQVDILNLFWEPGITDIQDSRHLFHVDIVDNDLLEDQYPQLANKLGTSTVDISQYIYDDSVDTTEKSAVIDWYYKKRQNGRTVLHYCKYVNDEVLFATENEEQYRDRGWYDHGEYPYVFDPLFRVEGTPCGFGFIDVGKSAQEYIDRGNQAFMQNLLANTRPRHFIRSDGSVNEEEYADQTKDFVHVNGNLGQDSILPIQGKLLSDIYVSVLNNKIDELKETTGNRDISNGGTTSGVTAASAIAAMQEAGSKLSRANAKASYRAFRKVVVMVVELIRQFYDLPRYFRILGENGAAEFVAYSNANIQPQYQGVEMGVDMGYRVPLFDIEVTAQKQSPYSKMSQNELALQFYSAGFFNPQLADQALATLEMMDFDRKSFVMERIAQNGTLYQQVQMLQQQMLQMAAMLDADRGTQVAPQMAMAMDAQAGGGMGGMAQAPQEQNSSSGFSGEASNTRAARERVAESTSPT